MRKFKIKNRQKRKYTRHTPPQSSYQLSTIFAGLLPIFILAIAFLTTMLMNLNLREQTVSFQPEFTAPQILAPQMHIPPITMPQISLTDMIKPFQSLPNLFTQPIAFLSGTSALVLNGIQTAFVSLGYSLLWVAAFLDPRASIASFGTGIQMFFMAIGSMWVSVMNGFIWITELLIQSLSYAGISVVAGTTTVGTMIMEFIAGVASAIAFGVGVVLEKIAWLVMFLFNGVVSILTFLFIQLAAFVNAVIDIILIPFNILGEFWLQIKPYFDILGVHMGMAGADLASGFESFEELATELNQ